MFDGRMFKPVRTGMGGMVIAVALAATPALADGPLPGRAASSLATPVSGAQLSEVRGEFQPARPPGIVNVRTADPDFADTFPGGDLLPHPGVGGEVATASARLEQRLTDVSMIAP